MHDERRRQEIGEMLALAQRSCNKVLEKAKVTYENNKDVAWQILRLTPGLEMPDSLEQDIGELQ